MDINTEVAGRSGKPLMTVQIYTPRGISWEGEAERVTSANSQGPFDILPGHAHFISLIQRQPIAIISNGAEKVVLFENAVIRNVDNVVSVYADVNDTEEEERIAKLAEN